jgi:hypothetical protein
MPSELTRLGAFAALLAFGLQGTMAADEVPEPKPRSTIFDLVIGQPAAEQPVELQEYACGTNGGPPSIELTGFADYTNCAVEVETGLHEVTFQYDDEAEYWALAHNLQIYADRFHGTKIGNHEVIVSALFDDAGILRGIRAVTDDRTELRTRFTAYQLSEYIYQQYAPDPWTCIDLPVAEGETPVAKRLIKQNCRGTTPDGRTLIIETRLLRRAGQQMIDPFSGEIRGDRFVASSRFEVLDPRVPVPDDVGADR